MLALPGREPHEFGLGGIEKTVGAAPRDDGVQAERYLIAEVGAERGVTWAVDCRPNVVSMHVDIKVEALYRRDDVSGV